MARKLISSTLVVALTLLLAATGAFAGKPTNETPVVTAFDVPDDSASPIPVLAFTATDSDGAIAGYLITEAATKPSAAAAGWSAARPTQYATSSAGTITLYAWAKDDKDAVSGSLSHVVKIPPPPVDADTLDGRHAGEFAAADHDHDGAYQAKYANVIVVAKGGGDFTDPVEAMNSITDASATNPYLLKIMPGVYDVGAGGYLPMKDGVDVEGSGRNATRITGSGPGGAYWQALGVVRWGSGCGELRSLTVEAIGGREALDGACRVRDVALLSENICVQKWGNDAHLADVELSCSTYGLNSFSAPGGTYFVERAKITVGGRVLNLVNGGSAVFNDVDAILPTGSSSGAGIFIHTSRFESSDSRYTGGTLIATWGSQVTLNNVVVDAGAALALQVEMDSAVQVFGGRYVGDIVVGSLGGDLKAVGAQFTGAITSTDTMTMTNCIDGSFAPIPNIATP